VLVPDINVLLYATNTDAPMHADAAKWWRSVLGGTEVVGLAWIVVLGFVRISTNPRIYPKPLSPDDALAFVDDWLALPTVVTVEPTDRHWSIFKDLIRGAGSAGNLTSDAHLAALAIEHGATLCSTDRDFGRFPRLAWRNPLDPGRR
jgi:toxin-antitoxin system PIN domain toxin